DAFHEKFFSNLGRSRVYELLAIGTGKKTVEDVRKDNRERKAKQRAKERVRDVTDTSRAITPSVTPVVRDVTYMARAIPAEEADPHAAHRALMETLAAESLTDHWRRCADELGDLLDEIGVDRLLKAMSKDFRAALRARLVKPNGKPFEHTLN